MRRAKHPDWPPMKFGVAGYAIVRETEREAQDEVQRHHRREAVGRGLRELSAVAGRDAARAAGFAGGLFGVESRVASGLVGTAEQVAERVAAFEEAGVDLLLLQFSPQLEEMERFAAHGDRAAGKVG